MSWSPAPGRRTLDSFSIPGGGSFLLVMVHQDLWDLKSFYSLLRIFIHYSVFLIEVIFGLHGNTQKQLVNTGTRESCPKPIPLRCSVLMLRCPFSGGSNGPSGVPPVPPNGFVRMRTGRKAAGRPRQRLGDMAESPGTLGAPEARGGRGLSPRGSPPVTPARSSSGPQSREHVSADEAAQSAGTLAAQDTIRGHTCVLISPPSL